MVKGREDRERRREGARTKWVKILLLLLQTRLFLKLVLYSKVASTTINKLQGQVLAEYSLLSRNLDQVSSRSRSLSHRRGEGRGAAQSSIAAY